MKEFIVGLFVILMLAVVTVLGAVLFPLLLLLGFFLRFLIGLIVSILVIWLIGKLTLVAIEYLRKPKNEF